MSRTQSETVATSPMPTSVSRPLNVTVRRLTSAETEPNTGAPAIFTRFV